MKSVCIYFCFLLCHLTAHSEITLPDVFSDNLVLKQNSKVKLWGNAEPEKILSVTATWSNEVFSTKTDCDGKWVIDIKTPSGSFNSQEIFINQSNSNHTISNVLIGEVWFCSGQSNMEMFFKGFNNQPIDGAKEVIARANKKNGIRILTTRRNLPDEITLEAKGKWELSTPKNMLYFSAVAYHFALELKQQLKVPVGIINSSYGGSTIEGWMNKETLREYEDVDIFSPVPDSTKWKKPLAMYNGMIYPYIKFSISGFLWYQGEGSIDKYRTYKTKLEKLVNLWRSNWIDGNYLPFYIVEITPYLYDHPTEAALLREAQYKASQQLENCEIVSTNDLLLDHEKNTAHPSLKAPIGIRLANLALYYDYGKLHLKPLNPSLVRGKQHGSKFEITIQNVYDGIQLESEFIGFEISGEDRVFYTAKAILNKDKKSFLISAPEVEHPISVRYSFKHLQIGNVKNSEGLPLIPFRTDDWD
jgi:sialate O-acetylesterase